MRYWWVNQNQTFRHEWDGGYLWSPKRNANGARNPFYESMREVSPGDVVFSFVDTLIAAIGLAQSYCWESPKPAEFGETGAYLGERRMEGAGEIHPHQPSYQAKGPHRCAPAVGSGAVRALAGER